MTRGQDVRKAQTDTRRLYKLEALFLNAPEQPGNKDTSIRTLRRLAARVWKDYNENRSRDCPPIIAGPGIKHGDVLYSYYEVYPVHEIVLSRPQRRPTVLLHEMTHALGKGMHDAAFCSLYFRLLHRYLKYDLDELKLQAAGFGIKSRAA